MRALQCTLEWDIKARDELRYSCTHTGNQSERSWIKAALLFLAERNKNRITLEATDDLGTLIVDPLQLARINYYLRGLAAWVGLGSPACNPSIFWAVGQTSRVESCLFAGVKPTDGLHESNSPPACGPTGHFSRTPHQNSAGR